MKYRVSGTNARNQQRQTASVEAETAEAAEAAARARGMDVEEVRAEDLYDRLGDFLKRNTLCEGCSGAFIKGLSRNKVCRACRRKAKREYEEQVSRRKSVEYQMHSDCLAELIQLAHAGKDTTAAVDAVLARWTARGMPSPETVFDRFAKEQITIWIEQGRPPILANPKISLEAGEIAHLQFLGVCLLENRIVSREWVDKSSGITLFDHGLALSLGESRAQLVDRVGPVNLGQGRLVLTSHRMVFASPTVGLNLAWPKVVSLTPGKDGFALVATEGVTSAGPVFLACADPKFICDCADAIRERGSARRLAEA